MTQTLGDIIKTLRAEDPRKVCPLGFLHPHSYRGYYDELAFEPAEHVSVAEMLRAAESALGATYEGWKGGSFTMDARTEVWLAEVGSVGETLGPVLLLLLLANGRIPDHPSAPVKEDRNAER